MKKSLLLLISVLYIQLSVTSQPYPESRYITSQVQIDSFQIKYPNCTEIEGEVIIAGEYSTNLNGLIVLTSIRGYLVFGDYGEDNNALTNLLIQILKHKSVQT